MTAYQGDIKRIMKQLMLVYETKIVYDKDRDIDRMGIIELMILEATQNEDLTQSDLLEMIPLKRAKLIGVIKRLTELNYLEKKANPNDKRSSYLTLGPSGQEILSKYGEHESIFLDFILRDMTINEEKAIVKFLSKIQQTNYMK